MFFSVRKNKVINLKKVVFQIWGWYIKKWAFRCCVGAVPKVSTRWNL